MAALALGIVTGHDLSYKAIHRERPSTSMRWTERQHFPPSGYFGFAACGVAALYCRGSIRGKCLFSHPRRNRKRLCLQSSLSSEGEGSTAESLGRSWASHKVTVLYDGACGICDWEINMLKDRQEQLGQSSILFVNIADEEYMPERWQGVDTLTAAGIDGKGIHGIMQNGEVVYGIPVFRTLYDELGWGWLFAAHDWPFFRQLMEAGYFAFAVNRLRVTGRQDDDAKLRLAMGSRSD
mmetsp:Transcript_63276/g.150916  ORF Transcript_63276/g.150916 Transcript_63276/m.150916 type:complete len:237 (-) Transcript_63276:186-896(-)